MLYVSFVTIFLCCIIFHYITMSHYIHSSINVPFTLSAKVLLLLLF